MSINSMPLRGVNFYNPVRTQIINDNCIDKPGSLSFAAPARLNRSGVAKKRLLFYRSLLKYRIKYYLWRKRYPYLHPCPGIGCWCTGRYIWYYFASFIIKLKTDPVV